MKKLASIILVVAFAMLQGSLSAQDTFIYKMTGDKLYFSEDSTSVVISFKQQEHVGDSAVIASVIKNIDDKAQYEMLPPRMMKLQTIIPFNTIIGLLSDYSSELTISKVYRPISDNHIHWCSNRIVVMLHSEELLRTLLSQLSVEYESISVFDESGIYVLTLSGMEDRSIQVANMLYETGLVTSSQPDFCLVADLCNPHYGNQWGLHNTGQYSSVYSGIDIKAPEAWDITRGSNVKVAVLDCGVDLTHPDLQNNLLSGYDATDINGGTYGGCILDNENGHGTACAGIIAAEDNNIGVVGIASSSKIIPIRAGIISSNDGLFHYYVSQVANAINKAWDDYGADVLSLSLTFQSADAIDIAINNALTNGRNGKGCVIAASAGNYYDNDQNPIYTVHYPASDSRIIAVGAISPCGERSSYQSCESEIHWGSCYGSGLSVVAPGSLIPTTDVQGLNGYNPTKPLHVSLGANDSIREYDDLDYTKWFAGTSAACPHVSGVAALMLSVNTNLTNQQVHNIIDSTAQKIRADLYTYTNNPSINPNGSWNNQMGYGLVNAHEAVMEAYFYNHCINGSNTISACDNTLYYYLNSTDRPNNTTVQWSVSSNLEIVSSNNTGAYIRAIGPGTGTISVSFTHDGYPVTKEKQIAITGFPISNYYYYNYSTTGNMTFNDELYIKGTFTVNSGHVVTVSCVGFCFPDSKIVVQPGGKLVIDDGKLINACTDKMWDGVYVVGNKNQRQLAQYQGTLEVKNGSMIKSAKCAIVTRDVTSNNNTTGGIVKCSNSTFTNNGKCAEFFAYTNHDSNNQECNNVSYFKNCNFTIDDSNLFSSSNVTYTDMIKLNVVKGIAIRGCHFSDSRAGSVTRGIAIHLADAGINIKPSCSIGDYTSDMPCNCTGESRNTFNRFAKGINVMNSGTNYPFNVFKANFENCEAAIYSKAANNYNITMSDFNMGCSGLFSVPCGIYSEYSTGYKIEGNDFYTTYTTNPSNFISAGIAMDNSGTDANTIHKNTFDKLSIGVLSATNNSSLQVLCNEFSNNFLVDVWASSSISPTQGTSSESAGNKFSSGCYNFVADNSNVTYYHSGTNVSTNVYCPYNSNNVTKVPNITANDCESTICLPPTTIDPPIVGPILGKSAPVNEDIVLYESLKQIYESRLADYNAAGYDFLLENFEDGDADIVATARLMQDTLISLYRSMAEIANRNIDAILQDTVVFDRDALNGWYNRMNTKTAKYSLVNSYFEVGEYALARQELAMIPQRFALTTDELAEYDNFCQYESLRESVYASGRNYAQLTEDEIAELQVIAERNTGVSSAYANSVLCFFYGICHDEELDLDFDIDIDAPMNSKSTMAVEEESTDSEPIAIYVYPNPADEELNILLNVLPEGRTMIEFHDVTGRLVLSEEIKSANTSINISSLKQGVYMYRIVNGENIIARNRIVKE